MSQLIRGKQIGSQTIVISGTTGNVVALGDLDMNNYQVLVSNYPTTDTALANKAYVDAVAQGASPHPPVKLVSIVQVSLTGGTTIDGMVLVDGYAVLLAGQTDKRQNGIWIAKTGTTAWHRRSDVDGSPENEIELGDFVFVETGATNASSGWILGATDSPDSYITPDVDTEEWYKISAPGSYTADGQGIELSGNIFQLELDGTTLSKSTSGLKLSDTLSSAISNNTFNISIETSSRSSADSSLSTNISTEISSRTSGDSSLSTLISSETSSRTSADSSLSTRVSTEISSRTSADSSLSTLISSETSIRSSADASLSTAILNINNPEVISEIVTPAYNGSTSGVTVSTTTFNYGSGVIDVDSVTVFLNGVEYPFAYVGNSTIFHTNGITPTGSGAVTLYFNGVNAGFGIETTDIVMLKYMVVT